MHQWCPRIAGIAKIPIDESRLPQSIRWTRKYCDQPCRAAKHCHLAARSRWVFRRFHRHCTRIETARKKVLVVDRMH